MSDLARAEVLVKIAKRNFETLSKMCSDGTYADEDFGWFVQQSVEKLLKAWLSILGEKYPRTHGLNVLLRKLEKKGCDVAEYWEFVSFMPYAVALRYDIFEGEDMTIDQEAAVVQVQSLYNRVEAILQSARADESENKTDGEAE